MQSIKRTLSPIHVDGFLNDEQTQQVCPRNKIYAPGQLVSGVARVKQDDMASVGKIWVELVGEQMTQIGETMINPEYRPHRQLSKTFFRQQQDLSVTTPREILGDFAYFSFGMSIPEYDMYGCDAEQASSADAVHKPLPPSLMILAGSLGRPAAYTPWSSMSWSSPQQAPAPPSNWATYRPTEIWKRSEAGMVATSTGFLKSLLKRKEDGPSQEIKVALCVPHVPSWPKDAQIPFHFTITATSTAQPDPNLPNTLNLSSVAVDFQLRQMIRVVAKGETEDHGTIRHSSTTWNGVDGKHVEKDFSAGERAAWTLDWAYNKELGLWESTRIIVGCFEVAMLPSFINGGLSVKYGLKVELSQPTTKSRQTFSLLQPVISSGFRNGLPVYDEGETIVPPAYWETDALPEKSG
ncbi:hypothetical protein QFC24_006786 [Naganishia onofrii]|uniref:Uncharacterized protein n=1 Tax=Naganishia onofrii TaxID=1851511 RepID=A0ACC2WYN1_9TREE|nr:hypothetical protein QFC24_006786 [Naganishia onofrii]